MSITDYKQLAISAGTLETAGCCLNPVELQGSDSGSINAQLVFHLDDGSWLSVLKTASPLCICQELNGGGPFMGSIVRKEKGLGMLLRLSDAGETVLWSLSNSDRLDKRPDTTQVRQTGMMTD